MNSKTLQTCWVILLAAGKGTRFGGQIPKCYRLVAGRPIISWSITSLTKHKKITKILPVINLKDESLALQSLENQNKCLQPVIGGNSRLESLILALQWIEKQKHGPDYILVHDAARPIIPTTIINLLINQYNQKPTCVLPVLAVNDSLAKCSFTNNTHIMNKALSRKDINIIQTPQLFNYKGLVSILLQSDSKTKQYIKDDIPEWEILLRENQDIQCIKGDPSLSKLTHKNDLPYLEFILNKDNETKTIFKSCLGYDIHKFSKNKPTLYLGGICVPGYKGLEGHSDADVLLHALCDALYGLSSYGDIGKAFPPSDNKWKNASSKIFVKHALQTLIDKKGVLNHVDCSIIAEQPKITDFRDKIITNLSILLKLPLDNISLKATTNEGLGCIGRSEGIASWVVCSASFTK